ncbi:MAG: enoyl-CoA hydratase/isomerase family protein [Candidatus Marinimicrobia bacterium]|nr:enoyl-CoA hydratase/isomerase family protein [Candidatus Neomarinimicrobiota bacterium]
MESINFQVRGKIAWVTIDRQAKLNALNKEVLDELEFCFQKIEENSDIGVVIITGAGEKSFVAGADINQFPSMTPEEAHTFSRRGQAVLSLIEASRKPVIAAVNGYALGGGCELAMACHLRYASENAMFGLPEVKLGVIAGFGGTQRLPRIVGTGRALDMLLSGRMITANNAAKIGLVNEVFPQANLLTQVEEIAGVILQQGPRAQAFTLESVYGGAGQTLEDALKVEASAFRDVFKTEDRIEGATAFLEHRPPEFKNR